MHGEGVRWRAGGWSQLGLNLVSTLKEQGYKVWEQGLLTGEGRNDPSIRESRGGGMCMLRSYAQAEGGAMLACCVNKTVSEGPALGRH